jgi:hypothetical protein
VTGLTDAQLRAVPVPVALDAASLSALESINVNVTNSATEITNDAGNPIPVSGTVTANTGLSQPLTDAQLRAVAVPVSGTFWQATQPVSGTVTANAGTGTFTVTGPLTDTQLRATAVPVTGTITVSNPTATGLTDTQLRASAVPVLASSLPLPTGAATETTLSTVNAKLPTLDAGRIPVVLPPGGSGLTDAELRATPVPVSGTFNASVNPDDTANMVSLLRALVHPIWEEANTGRLRVVLDPLGGAQTLGTVTTVGTVTTCSTVTTVSTVTNQAQMGGILTNSMVFDNMHMAWASSVRRAVT